MVNRFRRQIGLSAGFLLVGVLWISYFENQSLRQENSRLLAERELPLLLNGFRVDLRHVAQLDASPGSESSVPRQRLVLATSDQCTASMRNIGRWEALIKQVRWSEDQEIWLITFDGTDLPSQMTEFLRSRHIRFRLLRVEDAISFPLVTAITATPLTMLLDSQSTVKLVARGTLDEATIKAIRDHLNGHETLQPRKDPGWKRPPARGSSIGKTS